jgi:hypothetical protein
MDKKVEIQKRFTFDKATWKKVGKSFGLSCISAGGAFFASLKETGNVKASAVIAVATGGAFLLNTILEYVKGEPSK